MDPLYIMSRGRRCTGTATAACQLRHATETQSNRLGKIAKLVQNYLVKPGHDSTGDCDVEHQDHTLYWLE